MSRTLVLTAAFAVSLFSIGSFVYYLEASEKGVVKDNLLYQTGEFLDRMWFTHIQ